MLDLGWMIGAGLYLAVGAFALYMTWREHHWNRQANWALRFGSYLLCIAWPLVVGVMLYQSRKRPASFAPAEVDHPGA